MDSIEALNANLAITVGRLNAIHTAVLVIARALPREVASEAHARLAQASEAVTADALATPVPDALLEETQRVLAEVVRVLQHARDQQ
jgi:hypothetical protein